MRIECTGAAVCTYRQEPGRECSIPSALVLRCLASGVTCTVGLKQECPPNNLVSLGRVRRCMLELLVRTAFERTSLAAPPYRSPSMKLLARARLLIR